MITARKKKIEPTETIDRVRRACGEVWTQLAEAYHWLRKEHGIELTKGDAMALFATGGMTKRVKKAWESIPVDVDPETFDRNPFVTPEMRGAGVQQRQQVVRRFFDAYDIFFENLEAWREGRREERPNPPYRRKRYFNARWARTGGSSIKKEGDTLRLGGGRRVDGIEIRWPHPRPKSVEIGWEDGQPVVHAVYDSEEQDLPEGLIREREPQGQKVAGVDLGEIYLAAVHDGDDSVIVDGGKLRELRDLQNREKKWFQKRIDRKEEGSNRWWKLVEAKNKRLREIRDRIEDLLHKLSTRLVEELWARGVETIVIGDITGIRDNIDYGADTNRRLHQWAFREFTDKIEYKANRYGMEVEFEPERGTSKTCPQCGEKNSTSTRRYRCTSCGLEAHRDQVGAMNIRKKYQDPDGWSSGYLEAVRATANGDDKSPRGSPSGCKTPSETEGAAVSTRATRSVHSPQAISFEPHMDCVLADP
ncbi:MAG: RNA-guided endonuclease InsQ/TnpB family protein [Salinibacter sp.]|uniref:RNA-guided endonuclease InsQ/TnpB family protein n=1 Tax=Salinibacter sp. TaxID=2065818 RepID=UPI0035D49297